MFHVDFFMIDWAKLKPNLQGMQVTTRARGIAGESASSSPAHSSPCHIPYVARELREKSRMQATRDHDNAPGTAQDTGHQEQRADTASDADSEDDLLNQVGLRLYSVLLDP